MRSSEVVVNQGVHIPSRGVLTTSFPLSPTRTFRSDFAPLKVKTGAAVGVGTHYICKSLSREAVPY
jgi:hypothetical protein